MDDLANYCGYYNCVVVDKWLYLGPELKSDDGKPKNGCRIAVNAIARLVEAADEGVLLIVHGKIATANRTALTILGYGQDCNPSSLRNRPVSELLPVDSPGAELYEHLENSSSSVEHCECELIGAENVPIPVLIAGSTVIVNDEHGVVLTLKNLVANSAAKRDDVETVLEKRLAAQEGLISDLQTGLAHLSQAAIDSARAIAALTDVCERSRSFAHGDA